MKNLKNILIVSILAIALAFQVEPVEAQKSVIHSVVLELDATAGKAIGAHTLNTLDRKSFTLPDNARIVRSYYEVQTTFTSAGDSATISLGIETDDAAGIKAATAISAGGDIWDAGLVEGIQTGTTATTSEKTTAAKRKILATVAKTALTAGKFVLVLEYVVLEF